jgi:hypothetical protein
MTASITSQNIDLSLPESFWIIDTAKEGQIV